MGIFLSKRSIEEICEELAESYMATKSIGTLETEVDIAGLVTGYFKLRVYYVTFADDNDEETLGHLCDGREMVSLVIDGKAKDYIFPKNTILLSVKLKAPNERARRRFTLAHELFHYIDCLMNGYPIEEYMNALASGRRTSVSLEKIVSDREWRADRGAAALLMPKQLVLKVYHEIVGVEKIAVYGSDTFMPEDRERIFMIADRLGVSFTALMIRLREFGMLAQHKTSELVMMTITAAIKERACEH